MVVGRIAAVKFAKPNCFPRDSIKPTEGTCDVRGQAIAVLHQWTFYALALRGLRR